MKCIGTYFHWRIELKTKAKKSYFRERQIIIKFVLIKVQPVLRRMRIRILIIELICKCYDRMIRARIKPINAQQRSNPSDVIDILTTLKSDPSNGGS